YALVKGFGTHVHFSNKRGPMKQVYRKKLVCNKQGFKCLKDKRHFGRQPKRQRETRTGCEAMFQISLSKDGYWLVEKFNDVHNHEMIGTPSKVIKYHSRSRFHRSHACKRLISYFSESRLRPSQITKAVNIIKPSEEVDITPKQCSSILRAEGDEDFVTRNSKVVLFLVTQSKKDPESATLITCLRSSKKSGNDDKSRWRIVNYDNREGVRATCSCAKFETEGILCKHNLYIMRNK
ncbi:hypothetical protein RJ640_008701, partial [Escallonia rubra]